MCVCVIVTNRNNQSVLKIFIVLLKRTKQDVAQW